MLKLKLPNGWLIPLHQKHLREILIKTCQGYLVTAIALPKSTFPPAAQGSSPKAKPNLLPSTENHHSNNFKSSECRISTSMGKKFKTISRICLKSTANQDWSKAFTRTTGKSKGTQVRPCFLSLSRSTAKSKSTRKGTQVFFPIPDLRQISKNKKWSKLSKNSNPSLKIQNSTRRSPGLSMSTILCIWLKIPFTQIAPRRKVKNGSFSHYRVFPR